MNYLILDVCTVINKRMSKKAHQHKPAEPQIKNTNPQLKYLKNIQFYLPQH